MSSRSRGPRWVRVLARMVSVVAGVAIVGLTSSELAAADPPAGTWASLRHCESSGNYQAVSSTGKYRGAYQFDQPTWESVGGSGSPDEASRTEQDYRALYLYRMRGWQPWECADSAHLGLQNDADGASGHAPGRADATYMGGGSSGGGSSDGGSSDDGSTGGGASDGGSSDGGHSDGGPSDDGGGSSGSDNAGGNATIPAASGVPKWDGKTYFKGDCSDSIRTFQQQLNRIGSDYRFQATGCYRARTFHAIVQLQKANGINASGKLGPKTWYAAWNGKGLQGKSTYTVPSSAPKWDGRVYFKGDCSASLRTFQLRLNDIGAEPDFKGTSCYDQHTFDAVVKLQKASDINPSGRLGPKTWKAAWDTEQLG